MKKTKKLTRLLFMTAFLFSKPIFPGAYTTKTNVLRANDVASEQKVPDLRSAFFGFAAGVAANKLPDMIIRVVSHVKTSSQAPAAGGENANCDVCNSNKSEKSEDVPVENLISLGESSSSNIGKSGSSEIGKKADKLLSDKT